MAQPTSKQPGEMGVCGSVISHSSFIVVVCTSVKSVATSPAWHFSNTARRTAGGGQVNNEHTVSVHGQRGHGQRAHGQLTVGVYGQRGVDDRRDDVLALLEPRQEDAGAGRVAGLRHAVQARVGEGVGLIAADGVDLVGARGERDHLRGAGTAGGGKQRAHGQPRGPRSLAAERAVRCLSTPLTIAQANA